MATSSHYHPHYQAFPTNHDNDHHLYASLALWQSSHNPSPPSGPSSVLLQRASSYAQRQLPSYLQYAGSVDHVNHQPVPSAWSSPSHCRPSWGDSMQDGTFASRSHLRYDGHVEGHSPAPHPQPPLNNVRPHSSYGAHNAHQAPPQNAFHPPEQQQGFAQVPAPPNAPPFPPTAQRSAPVASVLKNSLQLNVSLHGPLPLGSQAPMSWPAAPSSDVAPPTQQTPSALSVSSWASFNGRPSAAATPPFERLTVDDSEWTMVHPPTEHATPAPLIPQLTLVPPPNGTQHAPATVSTSSELANNRTSPKQKKPVVASSFVERQKKFRVSRRHGPLNKEKASNAHKMRRGPKRVCIRCKFYKSGCDQGDPCQKCMKTQVSARVFHEPCCRQHIESTHLVRRCNGRFNQTEAEFLRYPWKHGAAIHIMEIRWYLPGFGPVSAAEPLRIKYCEYDPEGTDFASTQTQWSNTDGQVMHVEQPPYAAHDTVSLQEDVEAYSFNFLGSMEQWILSRNHYDDIAKLTYKEACRLRGRNSPANRLIDYALQLQCLSVVSQGYGTVWSPNVPGIKQYDFRAMGRSVYEAYDRNSCDCPLPGAINHQMDVAFVKFLKRLEAKCQKAISDIFFKKKEPILPWYELFLANFVLTWNLEYIYAGAQRYITSKNGTRLATQVNNVVGQQIVQWDTSYEVVSTHWRVALREFRPFKLARENPEALREKNLLPDDTAYEYMTQIVKLLDRTGPERFRAPFTGVAATPHSTSSKWIMELFASAGA